MRPAQCRLGWLARPYNRCQTLLCVLSFGAVCILHQPASAQEYQLDIGDKIRISVFGQKDLEHTATVNLDGTVWLPIVGRIDAAKSTLRGLHEQVSGYLTANNSIRPEDINIEIVEFRPFYVTGAVAKPGSYPFVPGLTVRQAIALAGGLARPTSEHLTALFQTDPRSSHASIRSEYLHHLARIARLRAELDNKPSFEWQPPEELGIPPDMVKALGDLQRVEFDARAEKLERDRKDLDDLIELAEAEIRALEQQDQRLDAEDERVTQSLAALRQLKERGVVSLQRIDESQRDVFSSRYARDSTRTQLAGARRQQAELINKSKQIDFVRREEITKELNLANAEVDVLQAQLASSAARTELAGEPMAKYCALESKEEGIFVIRAEGGGNKRVPAAEDGEVKPGDTIEVNTVSPLLGLVCRTQTTASSAQNRRGPPPPEHTGQTE